MSEPGMHSTMELIEAIDQEVVNELIDVLNQHKMRGLKCGCTVAALLAVVVINDSDREHSKVNLDTLTRFAEYIRKKAPEIAEFKIEPEAATTLN